MATEIVRWCDIHLTRHEENVYGQAHAITIDGESFDIDLCDDCWKSHLDPWVAVAREVGRTEKAPRKSRTGTKDQHPSLVRSCIWCPEGTRIDGTAEDMAKHVLGDHQGRTPSDMFGLICPVDGKVTQSLSGLGTHAHHNHAGVRSVSDLFDLALEQGDPHGIVAERRALA